MQDRGVNEKDIKASLKASQAQLDSINQSLEGVTTQISQLKEEMKAIESQAFKAFCKSAKVKTV